MEICFCTWLFGVTSARCKSCEVGRDMESRLSAIPSSYFYETFDWFHFWLTKFKSGLIQTNILRLPCLQLKNDLSCQLWLFDFHFYFIIWLFVCSVKGSTPDPKFQNRMGQKCQQPGGKSLTDIFICFTVKSDLSVVFFAHT